MAMVVAGTDLNAKGEHMNTTQSIIVYRNPIEQQLWESGMIFNVIVFMVLAVFLCVVSAKLVDRYTVKRYQPWGVMRSRRAEYIMYAALAASVGIAGYVAFVVLAI